MELSYKLKNVNEYKPFFEAESVELNLVTQFKDNKILLLTEDGEHVATIEFEAVLGHNYDKDEEEAVSDGSQFFLKFSPGENSDRINRDVVMFTSKNRKSPPVRS